MLIDRQYFERWGSMATSKSEMAELVTQLVMNSLPNDGSRYDIPMGSSTFCGGWDGYVESIGAHHFIPKVKVDGSLEPSQMFRVRQILIMTQEQMVFLMMKKENIHLQPLSKMVQDVVEAMTAARA